MTVRAKFYVSNLEEREGATAAMVNLSAVCRGVENAMWAQATPSGQITMYVKNDPAFEQFEKGAEYEVTFRKVAKPAAGDGHEIVLAATMHGNLVCETCGANMGFTDAAIESSPHLAQYNTNEAKADYRAKHLEVYGT